MNILGRPSYNYIIEDSSSPIPVLPDIVFPEFSGETIDGLRHLLTRLHQREKLPKSLSIVAALRSEGVSYLAQALAATIAYDLGRRVCLIDLNYWWPHTRLQPMESHRSLAGVIAGQIRLDEALMHTGPDIAILPAGDIPRQSRSIVANSPSLRDVVYELEGRFDHLILDIPAILATPDSVALASLSEAACLVIRQGATSTEDVSQALDEIEHIDIVGVVMNHVQLHTPAWLLKLLAFRAYTTSL